MRTCKWCGKQFDYSPFSRGSRSTEYCCGRCYNAAMHEEQRERQRNKEEADKFRREHPLISFIIGLIVIGYFAIIMIMDFFGSKGGDKQKQNVVENVVQQSIAEEKIISQSGNTMELASNEEPVSLQTLSQPNSQDDLLIEEAENVIADQNKIDQAIEEEIDKEIDEDNELSIEEEDFSKQRIYDIVEEMPSFPGGEMKLMEYIAQNIKYPQEALESGIQGRVLVNFIVEPNGSISNIKVLRGMGYGCDEEAIRVVESLPRFYPGKHRGESVRVSYAVPIFFRFQ